MTSGLSAIVVGGGPGGLATGLALLQAGLRVTVLERASVMGEVGAGLTIFPNGLRALERIAAGLGAEVASAGCECQAVTMRDDAGTIVHESRPTLRERFGFGMINLRWSTLTGILAGRLPAGTLRLGAGAVAAEEVAGGVRVRLGDGEEVRADVLVAADGVHSPIRQALVGDGPPLYAGHLSWRILLPPRPDLVRPHEALFYLARAGERRRSVGIFDLGGWTFVSAGAVAEAIPADVGGAGARGRMVAEFAGFAGPIAGLLESVEAGRILERPIWDRAPARTLARGRVALVGDAAHPVEPSLGQGANLAFEDALALGRALAKEARPEAGLVRYERAQVQRVAMVQAMSRRRSEAAYEDDALASAQEALARLQGEPGAFERWLYDHP